MLVKKLISQSGKKCPITAGTLKSSDLEPSLAGHYGVPTTSTTLAFDSIQCILAIASRDGRIKLFGADEAQVFIHSPKPTSCKFLQFLENQGILLNVTSRNDIEVWDVDKKELAHVYSCKEITAFTVLQGSPFMYIGDAKGNVSVLQFDRQSRQILCMQYSIPISITHGVVAEVRRDNSVVCILPQPRCEFSRVLVIFKNGLLILWGIQESQVLAVCGNVDIQLKKIVTVAYQRESQSSDPLQNRDNIEDKQISSACWACSNGSRIAVVYTDGDIWLWSVPTMSKLKHNSDARGLESHDSQPSPISKVQLSNRKEKMPIFSLKWHPGSDNWGCLYVYGGIGFDSSCLIRVAIEVSVPSSMAMLEFLPVEAAVGSQLPAAVTLRSSTGQLYSRCDAFNSFIRWQIFGAVHTFDVLNGTSWESFFGVMDAICGTIKPNMKASNVPVCAWTTLYASEAGKAALHAYLTGISKEFVTDIDAPVSLKVSWTVAAYAPLIIQQAGDGNAFGGYKFDLDSIERPLVDIQGIDRESLHELYLVPGSGMSILLHGGPERWRQGVEFVESSSVVAYDGKTQVKESIAITQLTNGGGRLHWISCHSLGNFTLTFKCGNLIGEDHPSPAIANVELPIVCSIPSSITVIADEPANTLALIRATSQADHSASHVRVTPITVTNGRTIRVAAVGIHQSGKPFANSSTFLLKWELSGCEQLAYWDSNDKVGRKIEAGSWERFLVLRNVSGQFLFDAAAKHCVEIATHRHGCCVLQRCVDHSSGAQRDCLVAEIAANGFRLSQDPFGLLRRTGLNCLQLLCS